MNRVIRFALLPLALAVVGCDASGSPEAAETGPLVSNLTARDGYELAPLELGVRPYADRSYELSFVPPELEGALMVTSRNNDKFNKDASLFTMTLGADADVFVAYDARVEVVPAWLNGWTKLDLFLGTTDVTRFVYTRPFAAGETVTLPGNGFEGGQGAESNYNLLVRRAQP